MDAAAAVAAELDAEREQAARINNRLRFAEDKILQQVCVCGPGGGSRHVVRSCVYTSRGVVRGRRCRVATLFA
jgi:hypothetical protein